MYTGTKTNQEYHDTGVMNVAQQVIQKGWPVVYSDLPGNAKPPTIMGYIPDVYAKSNQQELIVEVETNDSRNDTHSISQQTAFKKWELMFPTNRKFVLWIV